PADFAGGADIRQTHRLPAAGVVGYGEHDDRHAARILVEHALQRLQVDIALEGLDDVRVVRVGVGNVQRRRAAIFDVGAGGVEVGVVGDDVTRLEQRAEKDTFGGPALMGGDDVLEPGDGAHRFLKAVEAARPGVGLVAAHHS